MLFSCAEMRDVEEVFEALGGSEFRRRFRLGEKDSAYLRDRGLGVVLSHAAEFVENRLAPAEPRNDGRQTPMRGHPVFVAQHATATCCRTCLEKWHGIKKGRPLSNEEKQHVLRVMEKWLSRQRTTARDSGG